MSPTTRVGAVDVHYAGEHARAALAVYEDMTFSTNVSDHVADISRPSPYEPGSFFKRELPCIRTVLEIGPALDLLVVDGYATLNPQDRPGLGAYAAAAFGIPVIGVAKTHFRTATHAAEVTRGSSTKPLYVTTAGGLEIDVAARIVREMSGSGRVPGALARADALARGRLQPTV